jgi:aldehyde oxidoreductase
MATFILNGSEITVGDHHEHLLEALRVEAGITSTKDGCAPSGQCGCCTVLVDGKARVACVTTLDKVDGAEVTTLEGFDPLEVDRYANAFAAHGALQCGFCTPGIVVRTKSLIDKKGSELTREEASRHLGGHLCRCTGYIKILDAVESLARGDIDVPVTVGGVGTSGVKYEGCSLAVGRRPFVADMKPPGCLHGAFRLADHARADVVRIETSGAMAIGGVEAVFTAADVPGELRVGLIHKDWPVFIPEGGRTSYLGDVLAVVVAADAATARRAAAAIEVTYDVLPPVVDAVRALDDDDAVWGLDGNLLSRSAYTRGDFDVAFASALHTVHEVFQTQRVEHAFVEPESTLAVPTDDGRLHVYSGGQGVWDDRDDIAAVLGIDASDVTVELVSNGGAFGGKEDMSNQAQAALAAWLLRKPVLVTLTREQSLLLHPKRHPIRLEYWAGCDADGVVTALKVRALGDSGPYASVGMKVLERAAGHACGPYRIANLDVESLAVRTNNPVCGAFRGFGANQAQFAMEGVLDRLAEQVGISGWDVRSRNVIGPGDIWGPGQLMDDGAAGARQCLDAARDVYDAAVTAGKPVGIGLGLKNSGLGNGFYELARAVVRFRRDDKVEVRHCWTEMGQGVHTVAVQVAVEELGVAADDVVVIVDTTRELGAGQTTGSRGTLMGAGAIADACRAANEDGRQIDVDYEGRYVVDWTNKMNDPVDHPTIHSTFSYAAQVVIVDPDSGEIERVVAVHDVGRAVNPLLCEGQIEGSVHMGLGYALTEGFPADEDGRPTNTTLRQLAIIRPKDMPPVEVVLVEAPQPNAPYGIKGVGEIGLVPTAGAVAAALHAYDGEWRSALPMRNDANLERASAWS